MAALAVISAVATIAGTVMTVAAQAKAAKDAENIANYNAENTRRVAEYNAAKSEEAAGQEEAASQLRAREAKRQIQLKGSRVLALAAASGGGTMDPDVMNAIAGFEEEGDLEKRTHLYAGKEAARTLRAEGAAGIWRGESAARALTYEGYSRATALRNQAVGTLMSGASSLAGKYGEYSDGGGYRHSPSGRY